MALLEGVYRRLARSAAQQAFRLDLMGNQSVSKALPDYSQLAAARRVYAASTGAGTAIAPVTAMPTTAATWALFNGEDPGGPSYSVLWAANYSVSGTLGLGMALLGTVAIAAVTGTKPTAYASSHISSISGSKKTSQAILAQGLTMIGTPAWVVLASRDQVSAVSVGSGLTAEVKGLLTIPPGFIGAFTTLAPTGTTALFGISLAWAEVDVENE